MPRRVTRAMDYFEPQRTHVIELSISPILVGFWWPLKIQPECVPLRSRNANPGRLFRQCFVDELVCLVDYYGCLWFQFFQRCHRAHVIQMRMRQSNCLQFELVFVYYVRNQFGFVARIDADCFSSLRATEYATLLLESSDGK